jgi:hypothetical protein
MKRYISAILIPCLLLQLLGCYAKNAISINELSQYDEAIIITKSKTEYLLNKNLTLNELTFNSGINYCIDIIPIDDKLLIIKKRLIQDTNNNQRIILDSTQIPVTSLNKILVDKIDVLKSSLLIATIGLVIAFFIGIKNFGGTNQENIDTSYY